MATTDYVSSISGRNSRASNVSGITVASRSVRAHPPPKDTLTNAGVLSMLKTTTDTGDIGSLSFNSTRLPTMPRAIHQRRGHHPRPSVTKHHYAPSQMSGVSSSRDWETISNQRRGSLTSMQSMPPSLPPVHLGRDSKHTVAPLADPDDGRSYSLTSAPAAQHIPRHRSATSLKTHGREGRHLQLQTRSRAAPPSTQENRPPYIYPTRLKRPGFRAPSPALSDSYVSAAQPPSAPSGARRMPARPRVAHPQPYSQEYDIEYPGDPRYLNIHQPPRVITSSPVSGYSDPPPLNYLYRNPAALRSATGLNVPQVPRGEHYPHIQGNMGRGMPPAPPHAAHGYGPALAVPRPPYAAQPFPARSIYPHGPPAQYATYRSAQPPSNVNPMAHQIFHNAARLARHLPLRTDTPMTDLGPPASDPPSSGTAPTSSSPATPKDYSTIQVAVDPAFIEPALADLQDSSSEPVMAHQYLRYAEGLEKDVEDSEIEAAHPSVPPSGFVQRVKAMLESKAAAEAALQNECDRERVSPVPPANDEIALVEYSGGYDPVVHELAAEEAARFTVIEEYDAPVELPASPVRVVELPGSSAFKDHRITRDLVKAELAPSSAENSMSQDGTTDRQSIDGILNIETHESGNGWKNIRTTTAASQIVQHEPSTPAEVIVERAEDALSETTTSLDAMDYSAVDYTSRFEATMSSEETQSGDPFILDADTITLQNHRNKEHALKPGPHKSLHQPFASVNDEPVSPILSSDGVSRDSAVSPMHTQTLGIDETLRAASEVTLEDHVTDTLSQNGAMDGLQGHSQPLGTPHASKRYSKSVQLQPKTASINGDNSTSNRFSLPHDLSTFSESTMNDSTNMITDIAVRFSLPQTTVTVSKPQIIEIPPSSSPVHGQYNQQLLSAFAQAPAMRSKRGSVTFADEVAPLNISKKLETFPIAPSSVESGSLMSNSNARRVLYSPGSVLPARISRDATTETYSSTFNKFGTANLPELKEESVDEMSVSDKNKSHGSKDMQFSLPARIAAVKAMQERRLQETAEKAKARRARRGPNRPLAETRDLPSLNFSRMDLIDKLNEALEVREAKSMEIIRRREFSGIYCPSPQRPQSTEPLRERYMSFFSKPEDFSSFLSEFVESNEGDGEQKPKSGPDTSASEELIATEAGLISPECRSLSPEDFLNFANEVNRLSVPSVTGLSDRLSEILPNLRELQLDSILAGFAEAGEITRGIGDGVRPGTVLSTRTSAGFRTLAERAEEIVKNGTHDSTVPASYNLSDIEELPTLSTCFADNEGSKVQSIDGKRSYLSGSKSAPTALGKDVTLPASALTRHKSPTNEEEVQALLPPEMNPITRHGRKALLMSSSGSRPWNQDENYPWAETKLDVDLAIPSRAHARSSTASEVIRARKNKSFDLTGSAEARDEPSGIDIGSLYEHNPTASITSEQLTGCSSQNHHKSSKCSVIGSLTKKLAVGPRSDGNTTRSVATPSDMGRSGSTIPHGERYPTSGLSPLTAFNLDEVRSFFSDDSSERGHNASFRKRLTKLKSKKSLRLDPARSQSRNTIEDDTTYDAGQMSVERVGAMNSSVTIDGVGMGKTEFRIKRFGEKLRHLMVKGGELIRSLSQRSKMTRTEQHERVRDDWLSDSLYSGV